jgi:hypothetical protein
LSHMELTERLSSGRLAALESNLRGKKAREALIALADESVFLDPAATEILSMAPPDMATQRMMFSRTVDYVVKTIPRLPNFYAERTTVLYHEASQKPGHMWKTSTGDPSLYASETSKATVLYRDGKEVVNENAAKRNPGQAERLGTFGTFGPVLGVVLTGATAAHGELTWSRWEKGSNGPQAVFRYRATNERPLFRAGAEYLTIEDSSTLIEKRVPFHGEFAIDPATGAILRLTIQADLEPRLPLDRSNIMVEYGPVLLGGTAYVCPLRSVSISRQRRIMDMVEWTEPFKVYAPFETLLNDMTFGKYHLFHSTARILPGFTPAPQDK